MLGFFALPEWDAALPAVGFSGVLWFFAECGFCTCDALMNHLSFFFRFKSVCVLCSAPAL